MTADESQQIDDLLSRWKMFRKQVRGVDVPSGFSQFDCGIFGSLLGPEASRIDVPQLAHVSSAADADSGGGTCPYCKIQSPTRIFNEGLISETYT